MPRLRISIAVLLLLSGCGPLLIRDGATGAYSPVQAGTFELHKDITLRADHARAYLQHGEIVSAVNEFAPHCQLEINTLQAQPQTVHADSFSVTRINTRSYQVVQNAPVVLAAAEGFTLTPLDRFRDHDDAESRIMYAFIFTLHSARQPDVRALRCGGAFDAPGLAQRPTLQEIAAALGAYGTLVLRR
ncbi:MAG: hypothetical protein HY941_10455 [Gammaproteobacteria bacterium]|nr:hypothetical protein [Gammaproteobacteria bacterium]